MPSAIVNTENSSVVGEDSEDDFDWEEVEVAQPASLDGTQLDAATAASLHQYYADVHAPEEGPSTKPHIEITIKTQGKGKGDPK